MNPTLQSVEATPFSQKKQRSIPQKSDSRCRFDTTPIDIPRSTSDDTPNSKTYNDTDVLQEWGSEEFSQDDANEGEEAEADEFW